MFGAWAMRGLGGLLLLAAALKMYGLAVEPVGRLGILSDPWLQVAIVEWEVILGLWLLSGYGRIPAWTATVATFVGFACVNLWQGSIGQSSCGCLGTIHVNPWMTFAFDLSAIIVVWPARRYLRPEACSIGPCAVVRVAQVMVVAGVILLGFVGIGLAAFGSVDAALAYLRGNALSITPARVDLGVASAGTDREETIEVTNWSSVVVRIIGGTDDCVCDATGDLPVSVGPEEKRTLRILVRLPRTPGLLTANCLLRTDHPRSRVVPFRVNAQVRIVNEGKTSKISE